MTQPQKILLSEPGGIEGPQVSAGTSSVITYMKAADAAASTTTAETVIGRIPAGFTWSMVRVSIMAAANVTADAAHYATLTLSVIDDGDPASHTTPATIDTSTVSWTAKQPAEMTVDPALGINIAGATTVLGITVGKTGNGVQLPILCIAVEIQLVA